MDWSAMVGSLLRVLFAGLVFGAGAAGDVRLGCLAVGQGHRRGQADGTISHSGNRVALASAWIAFAVVLASVLLGILWITQKSLQHYFGFSVFSS